MKRVLTWLAAIILIVSCLPVNTIAADDDNISVTANYEVSRVIRNLEIQYSDDLFRQSADHYNHDLAKASAGLTVSAFRDVVHMEAQDDNFISFAEQIGMSDIETTPFASQPTTDSICFGIASKQIDDFTLIAVGVCGQSYGKEWASNLTVGTGIRSQGFDEAAQQVENAVYQYIMRNEISGNIKIWISGYSRAGATSNIAAADFTDSGLFSDVYAYCFACPRTTKEPGNYNNIYNIMSKDDLVPRVPLPDWGFERYGKDLYYKSTESDSDAEEFTLKSAEVYMELTGSGMPINHDISSELRTVLDYLYLLFPTAESYAEGMQGLVRGLYEGEETADVVEGFLSVLTDYARANDDQQYEIDQLREYIQMLVSKYILRGNEKQIASGAWNPELGAMNFFNEHLADKYIARLFAYDDPVKIYSDNGEYTHLIIFGKHLNLQIENEEGIVETINDNTNIVGAKELTIYSVPIVDASDDKIEITLPRDQIWWVYINTPDPQLITYGGMWFSENSVRAHIDKYYVLNARANIMYDIETSIAGQPSNINADSTVHSTAMNPKNMEYSPSVIMRMDTFDIAHVSVREIVLAAMYTGILVVLELIIVIILAIIRKAGKRKRKAIPTIIFHLINVVVFTLISYAIWYFVPEYPIGRTISRTVVFMIIAVLLIKAYRRYRIKPWFNAVWISIIIMLADLVLEHFYMGHCEGFKRIIPILVYAVTFAAACVMWGITYRKYDKYYLEADERSYMDSQL